MKEVKEAKQSKFLEKIENAIAIFSPKFALTRKMYRLALGSFNSYRGADKTRMRESWIPGYGSPDEDLLPELATLRERSRDLNRNDAHASGITHTIVTNVIGTGIKPQSRVDATRLGLVEKDVDVFQKSAERAWQRWVPFADAGNRMDFYEIQQLIERQILENGEVLIIPLMVAGPERPYMLALEIVEADRLATPPGMTANKKIRYGVEIGDRGEPVAYWIRKTHPGDITLRYQTPMANDFIRYPAKNELGRPNVFHLYWEMRPGQTRGVPFFTPVLNYFKDLADYMEAELVAARVGACFAAFIKKVNSYDAGFNAADQTNAKGQRIQSLEPGLIEYLAPGEEITAFNPTRPGGTFEPFVERILRAISAGLNLPYEVVAKDFSRSSYSSARAALLEARKFFKAHQDWIAKRLCQPVWEMLIEEAYLLNELKIQNFYENSADWTRARWIAPGWGWVDPTKEVEASRMSIEGNLSTLADEAATLGRDWEETLEQRAREKKKLKELGIEEIPVVKNPTPNAAPAGADPNMPPAGKGKNAPAEVGSGVAE